MLLRYPLMLGEGVRSTTNSSTTEKGIQKDTGGKQKDGRLKGVKSVPGSFPSSSILNSYLILTIQTNILDLGQSAASGNSTMSEVPSPKGPIIHDVTDIDDSSCADLIENCNDLDNEQIDEIAEVVSNEKSSEAFFPIAQISELPISVESAELEDEIPAEEEEVLEDE